MQSIQFFTHMQGPVFLAVYATIGVAFFVFCLWIRHETDRSKNNQPIEPEVDPDPYKIAYLRGGTNEVLRMATLELYCEGLFNEVKPKLGSLTWQLKDSSRLPSTLSPFASTIAPFFAEKRKPTDIFKSTFGADLSDTFRNWDRWIEDEGLRLTNEQQGKLSIFATILSGTFFAIGAVKIISALSRDLHNVGFAVLMLVVGTLAIFLTRLPRRFNVRGREFLRLTQLVNIQHKTAAKSMTFHATEQNGMSDSVSNNMVPMMAMGIFGVAALNGSPFNDFRKSYLRAESNGGGCGSSCAGASWSAGCGSSTRNGSDASGCGAAGGASCGGGGGGGAGCGGGGCGGGGCGGCGGS